MANSFWQMVNWVITQCDTLIEVVDARVVEETRNKEIEEKVRSRGKRLLIVINKCDLARKEELLNIKKRLIAEGIECVFISAKKHFGNTMLKRRLLSHAGGKEIKIGILGYPNTGKSSVINVLKGTAAAPTSSVSSTTRSLRNVRIHQNLILVDTPGVYPAGSKDEWQLALISARSPQQLKDPDIAAMKILQIFLAHDRKTLEAHYRFTIRTDDTSDLLDDLAKQKNLLLKGGEPDSDRMARMIVNDWQTGKLMLASHEPVAEINDEPDVPEKPGEDDQKSP